MNHHTIVMQEIEAAMKTVDLVNQKIEELVAQRNRFQVFVDAMKIALPHIPEQLEFELVEDSAV